MALMDGRTINVILLGFGFMFVFAAFQTTGNIEATVLDSIKHEYEERGETFNVNGFTSLAIVYIVFALCNWVAPSVISLSGPRIAMVVGSILYTFFIITFLFPRVWLLYFASVVIGFGAAVIWTGQGNYLTLNSDKSTMARNSGIFWAMLQCSMFIGNIFVFFQFQGLDTIDQDTRRTVFIVLSVLACVGIVFFIIIAIFRPPLSIEGNSDEEDIGGPMKALVDAAKMCVNLEMSLLMITFFYTGIELTFFSGVYGPSLGNVKAFGDTAKQLVGLSGIFVGVGEVLGGLLFTILGRKTNKWGRDPIVIVGFILHIIAFFLIFLNIPWDAPLTGATGTTTPAHMTPNSYVAILCSFLLGFGDSCFNTQIYSMIGSIWSENSVPAFAVFKFVQSVAAAVAFFYSSAAGLEVQLSLLIALATVGTVSFCYVELRDKRRKRKEKQVESEASSSVNEGGSPEPLHI